MTENCKDIHLLSIELPKYSDARGCLVVASGDDMRLPVPFDVKRAFWIKGVPQDVQRGGHAHRTCDELLVCLSGSMTLQLHDGTETATYLLKATTGSGEKEIGVLIPRMVWCELQHFSPDCICLCLASEAYDAEGYINDFEQFLAEAQK